MRGELRQHFVDLIAVAEDHHVRAATCEQGDDVFDGARSLLRKSIP
jgi:hypothetical protein